MDNRILGPSLGISEGLLKRLDELFPDTLPSFGTPQDEIIFRQGSRAVIEKLVELSEDDFIEE